MNWEEPPKDKIISIDFETLSGSYEPEIMALAWDGGEVVYDLMADDIKNDFFKWLDNCKSINAHNIEFELKVLKTWGYDISKLEGKIDDSMVMIAVNDSEQTKGLKEACKLVEMELREWKEASKDTREAYMKYCLDDAIACHKLLYLMMGITEKNGTWAAYNLEIDCIWWAVESYFHGVYVDQEKLMEFRNKYTQKIQECLERMVDLSGAVINFNSTEQLRNLLFKTFEIKPATEMYTSGGKGGNPLPSTSLSALKFYSESKNTPEVAKEFLKTLLDYRKYSKLRNTYTSDKFIKWIWDDGKIHPNVFLTGTRTGRMSYRDPPMQTIPSRGEGAELRNIVASTPGTFLVRADLGQMEYRLLAHFTQDKFLMDAYKTGRDLHEETGKLFGVSRDAGKQCNFSVIYGQGISALSAKIKKSKEETSKLMQQYFERFSKVKDFKDNVINYAYANKHIRTMSGRIRGLSRYMEYEDGSIERLAVNTVIQGANADMIKMIICKQRRLFRNTDIKCILQVHDELIFEFPNSYDRKKAENMIEKLMTETYPLSIPVEASVLSGNNWSEAKD